MVTAKDVVNKALSWLGLNEHDGSHMEIVDIYNSHTPLANGYQLSYSDSWCDAFVSAVFIALDAVSLIGATECGVERHIDIFKKNGIWNEDGTITPQAGDIICFNWDQSWQPNDGFADHIGIVQYVDGNTIHTIEGNAGNEVRQRTYSLGHGNIRGFARPKYATDDSWGKKEEKKERPMLSMGASGDSVTELQNLLKAAGYTGVTVDGKFGFQTYCAVTAFQKTRNLDVDGIVGPKTWAALDNPYRRKSVKELATEIIQGKWGNGVERKRYLAESGYYNYEEIQAMVNRMLR